MSLAALAAANYNSGLRGLVVAAVLAAIIISRLIRSSNRRSATAISE
jgi:hypothetical protein